VHSYFPVPKDKEVSLLKPVTEKFLFFGDEKEFICNAIPPRKKWKRRIKTTSKYFKDGSMIIYQH